MPLSKSWFVQTEFGTTLGPMPDDALLEMIRTGALLRSDQVRVGSDDEWRVARDVPGLFEAASASPMSGEPQAPVAVVAMPVVEALPIELPSVAPPVSSNIKLIPPLAPTNPKPVPVPEKPPTPVVSAQAEIVPEPFAAPQTTARPIAPPREKIVSATAPPEDDLIASWRAERRQTRQELGLVSLAAEMTQAEDENEFAPELPAELLDDESEPSQVAATITKPAPCSTVNRPAFLDQIEGLEDGPRQRVETSQEKWHRWRRSLPTWPIASAALLIVFAAWFYWPRSSRGIYERYVAVWQEWQIRRTDFKDKEGWDRFLKHTEAELDDTLPWLEANASAERRDRLLLLWIGRDCYRKMLKKPRQLGSVEEKQLQLLLTSVREYYEPGAATADGGQDSGKNADPERAAGAGVFDPSSVRRETKSTSPVEPAAPAKADDSPSEAPATTNETPP